MMLSKCQWCVICMTLAILPICLAQDTAPASRDDATDKVVQVVRLQHADAGLVANAINSLGLPTIATTAAEDVVVLRGAESDVRYAIDAVIKRVDVPDTAAGPALTTEFIPLGQVRTQTLMPALQAIVSGESRMAIDHRNQMLVVRGTHQEIGAIRRLLDEVNTPSQPLTLNFHFIRASIDDEDEDDPEYAELPKNLMPIAVTLAANGFWSPTVIAPIIVLTDEGQEFESQSQLWWDGSPGKNEERLRFVVEGHARLQQAGNIAEVTIHASMKGHYLKPGSEGAQTMFEVKTTVAAKLGSYVIIGASPSSTARGNAVALVMHITRD